MLAYNIWWPGDYNHKSGGIRALYVLRDELRARGLEAELTRDRVMPGSVMLYPEGVRGNPHGHKKFVKWLLNKADHPGEKCWAWEKGFGECPLLTVSIIDRDVWRPVSVKRGGTAYWVGKARLDPSVLPAGCQEISLHNFPDRRELAEFVANLDLLISFDPLTAILTEATIAGTPVLLHNTCSRWTTDEVRHLLLPGVATAPEELDHARQTVHLARDRFNEWEATFASRIDHFVEVTQAWGDE